jgi:hypothetical protein
VAFAFEVFILAETKMLAPRARLQRVNDGLADVSVSGIIRLFEVPGLPSTASFLGEAHTRGREPAELRQLRQPVLLLISRGLL